MILFAALLLFGAVAFAAEPDVIVSQATAADFELTADPDAPEWQGVPGVEAANDALGNPSPGARTEIRSRWSEDNLYFLFICHYEKLHLKPDPVTDAETPKLWEWDVAEVFIGADFQRINRYREFQVSPRGEYLDLDINSEDLNAERDMKWNSGYKVKARLDETNRVWYGAMKIPISSIDSRPPRAGNEMRVNFYRLQGPGPKRSQNTWRPTNHRTHHVPESFGRIVLGE